MRNILILGATSGMAQSLAKALAGPDTRLLLAGRDRGELDRMAADLALRRGGPEPVVLDFDARRTERHGDFAARVMKQVEILDELYLFFGTLHDQRAAEADFDLAKNMLEVNFTGAVSVLERFAGPMARQGRGLIVGVSSVAGDRGRQSNYLYGSAKAGLTLYLAGLRNRLAPAGVHVMTAKPGFVATRMTRGMKQGLLFSDPDKVVRGMIRAARAGKNVAYLPGFWRWIMWVIRMIPEGVFKRMRL